jgi:hypothetical protein
MYAVKVLGFNGTVRADYNDWIGQGYTPPYFEALEVFKGQRKLAITGLKKLSGPPLISAAFLCQLQCKIQ